jgi:hypothetical protein
VALIALAVLLIGWPSPEPGAGEPAAAPMPPSAPHPGEPVFRLADGWWELPRYGLRMRLPGGWTAAERRGRPYLQRDAGDGGAGGINVLALPNFLGKDIDGLREENRRQLELGPDLELIGIQDVRVSDLPALRVDYRARVSGSEVRCACCVILLGGYQVVVTATIPESAWSAAESAVDAALGSLERIPADPTRTPAP